MIRWLGKILRSGPDLHPINVIATGATAAALALLGGTMIAHQIDTGDVLAFIGAIAGSAIGATLAVNGAIRVERWKGEEAKRVQNRLLMGALKAIAHTAENLRTTVAHESLGVALALTTTAHQVLRSRRQGLLTVRQALLIENFEIFEKLQTLDDSLMLAIRLDEEILEEMRAGDGNSSQDH